MEISSVLEAMKEDELADFNPEDIKRMEKEDRDYFERKKGRRPESDAKPTPVVLRMVAATTACEVAATIRRAGREIPLVLRMVAATTACESSRSHSTCR